MKKLLAFVMLLSFTAVGMPEQVDSGNVLILQGELFEGDCATIELFQYDADQDDWCLVEQAQCRSYYFLTLNPTLEYKIMFHHESGYTKTAIVEGGESGVWHLRMNVDFANVNRLYTYIRQTCGDGEYPVTYGSCFVNT